MELKFNTGK